MSLWQKYYKKWQHYTGNQCITISGQVSLRALEGELLLTLTAEEWSQVQTQLAKLQELYPMLQLQAKKSLAEVSLSFFAYEAYLDQPDFLEVFRQHLVELVTALTKDRFHGEVWLRGKLLDRNLETGFLYLNKGTQVEYTQEYSRQVGTFSKVYRHKLLVYLALALFLYLGANRVYDYYHREPEINKLEHSPKIKGVQHI